MSCKTGNSSKSHKKSEPLTPKEDRPVLRKTVQAASLADILGLTPSAPSSKSPKGKVPTKWQGYYEQLVQLKDQLEQTGWVDATLYPYSNSQILLNEVKAAIDRIFNGTYGVCEITHLPIKKERLEAIPYTRYSSEGQKQIDEEQALQQLKDRQDINEEGQAWMAEGNDFLDE